MTGVALGSRSRPLERRDQRGGFDLPVRQSVGQRLAGGNELRLPANSVLAVGQIVPAGIGREVRVLADVCDELPRFAVVEADAAAGPLPATDGILPPLVRVHPVVAGFRYVTGDPRPAWRTNERHAFGPLRYGKEVGGGQQVIQEYLQAPVEQRRARDVALLPARRPQPFVHFHVEQKGPGHSVHPDAPHGSEEGTVLEGLAQDRFQTFVEVMTFRQIRGLEVSGIDVVQPPRHAHGVAVAHESYLAAAVQHALRLDLVRPGGDREGVLVRGRGDRLQRRLQSHGRPGDRAGLEEFEDFEVDGNTPESLQDQLDVARRRHDRRVVDAMVRQPPEVLVRESGLEQRVLGGNLVSYERTVRVLALSDEHLVVTHGIGRRLFVSRMAGKQVGYGFRPRILGLEIELGPGPEERAECFLKVQADIAVPHQRRNAERRLDISLEALHDHRLQAQCGAISRKISGLYSLRTTSIAAVNSTGRRTFDHQ